MSLIRTFGKRVIALLTRGPATAQPGPDAAEDPALIDRATSLLNREGLRVWGDEILIRCRQERLAVSLAVLDCGALLGRAHMRSGQPGGKTIEQVVQAMTQLAGRRGFAARTGPAQFTVALTMAPHQARSEIEDLFKRLAQSTGAEDGQAGQGGQGGTILTPYFIVESMPSNLSLHTFHAALCRRLSCLKAEQRQRLNPPKGAQQSRLQPRPAPPFVAPKPVEIWRHFPRDLPNTIPMPLQQR